MTISRKIKAGVAAAILLTACSSSANAENTNNDVVLLGDQKQYIEYYKCDDGRGCDKNYLYTRSEIEAPAPGKCVVVTAASEQTIAVSCNYGAR
jgi:hypothetical protein